MPELTLPLDEALRLSPGCTSILDEQRRPRHPDLAERLRREGFDPEQPIETKLDLLQQEVRFRQPG